jgi:DNA polymerase III epsilon subunit-like protein
MSKKICFLYTETTGLHQTYDAVTKKNLFCFARPVIVNYEIGSYNDGDYITENQTRTVMKPRCMIIPENTVQYHGITQKYALKKGTDPEIVIQKFKDDLKDVQIIVSHNIDFHLKTIIAEAVKYNISIDFTKFIIIDTISFYHNYSYPKLKDLAEKLSIKNIPENNLDIIQSVFFKLYRNYKKSIK